MSLKSGPSLSYLKDEIKIYCMSSGFYQHKICFLSYFLVSVTFISLVFKQEVSVYEILEEM